MPSDDACVEGEGAAAASLVALSPTGEPPSAAPSVGGGILSNAAARGRPSGAPGVLPAAGAEAAPGAGGAAANGAEEVVVMVRPPAADLRAGINSRWHGREQRSGVELGSAHGK